ncbi:hypothetical protein ADL01_14225 [Streptomyces sp. NRRL WC-3618]|uniref:hypothetical protein n=1 Tax=Streptomyces sp. NRRL WC-3618 TaxID=1519490 RepID=UPI0006B018B2|nr:hypothetical protein [Streptomyces sp. NRRL WC-3618]KOV78764.1 hypothetical protein ADL01_14225 [Streptomyces sp. NRRL WC-3618]
MTTSLRPRRAGARTAVLAALTLAGTTLVTAHAVAAPGDNGDVKIHKVGTPFTDQRNEPKVCDFYLAAFNFDDLPDNQDIEWSIETQPLETNGATLADTIQLEDDGTGHTMPLSLPDGQYKLTWKIVGGQGAGKHKVFQVDCPTGTPTGTPTPPGGPGGPGGGPGGPHGGPHGGVPAGGGGVARVEAFSPVAGAAAVGLIVVGGVVYLRTRRRADGAA